MFGHNLVVFEGSSQIITQYIINLDTIDKIKKMILYFVNRIAYQVNLIKLSPVGSFFVLKSFNVRMTAKIKRNTLLSFPNICKHSYDVYSSPSPTTFHLSTIFRILWEAFHISMFPLHANVMTEILQQGPPYTLNFFYKKLTSSLSTESFLVFLLFSIVMRTIPCCIG